MGLDMYLDVREDNQLENLAYWRKVNQIHKFFCDLDGGRDECQPIAVKRSDLEELVGICVEIQHSPHLAPVLLPTQVGFFFGSYEYDEWYMEGIDQTVDQLTTVLMDYPEPDWEFVYQASW
jgi:hypothetical protein